MPHFLTLLLSPAGIVLLPLGICSVLAVALILDRWLALLHMRAPDPREEAAIRDLARRDTAAAVGRLQQDRPFYAGAVQTFEDMTGAPRALREDAVSLTLSQTASHYTRRLSGLTTLAGLSPLLGLTGTVIGLMAAFRSVQETAGPVDPAALAGGLWQAMITTAAGLLIAAPCLVAHALLKSRIHRKLRDAGALLSALSLSAAWKNEAPHD